MLPLIHDADQVLVEYGPANLRRGHIVLFRQESGLVAHRVILIKRRYGRWMVITKGDNVGWFDRPLAAGLLGRVIAVSHAGRTIRLDTPWQRAAGWVVAAYTSATAALCRTLRGEPRLPGIVVARTHAFLRLVLRLAGEPSI